MPKFSIFSHTGVSYSGNSKSLHRHDLRGDEDMKDEEVERLLLDGHRIVDVWEDGRSTSMGPELKGGRQSSKLKSGNQSTRER